MAIAVTRFVGFAMIAGFVTSIAASPLGVQVPQNVDVARLGDGRSSLSLELVQVPYYVGEDLILRVTVRNTHPTPMFLPSPTGLLVNEHVDPSPYRLIAGHTCPGPAMEVDYKPRCIEGLKSRSVLYAPGQTRSALWATTPLDQVQLGDPSPLRYGVLFSSHGIVGEVNLRVTLHRLTDMSRGRLLRHPTRGHMTYYFVAPAWEGKHLVLSMGAWDPNTNPPPKVLSTAAFRDYSRAPRLTRHAVVLKPNVSLELDQKGHLLVDGVRRDPPSVFIVQPGWITSAERGGIEAGAKTK
jgi:hypothetical protein